MFRKKFDIENFGAEFWANAAGSDARDLFSDPSRLKLHRSDGLFPIHMAAYYGSAEVLEAVVTAGADPNQRTEILTSRLFEHSLTPMFVAMYSKHHKPTSKLRVLLEAGADTEAVNHVEMTPLHCCAQSQYFANHSFEFAKQLIAAGSNLDSRDKGGYTPLISSIDRDDCNIHLTLSLLNAGASPNIATKHETTALDQSIDKGSHETFMLLLRRGANPNAVNNGSPALHRLLPHMPDSYVLPLLEAGADPLMKDSAGLTAIEIIDERIIRNRSEINQIQKDRPHEKSLLQSISQDLEWLESRRNFLGEYFDL
ncbi:ankyrin repeat domain-containing protein [Jannaschia aquimarina]|uniref:Ankyrin repeat protein n=1 Tax=Jannaschia aquimarina TaxID=935700 RepID=A0A0D1CI93_9RHOB|nr:ankyrin repeat domain-containing protein [Jannaschia aquimarina]KIT14402.1 Ankyrin repeat protein [Jannaschia aquimarina]SNT44699.1 cytohesin [Jannaschia aquimarina]